MSSVTGLANVLAVVVAFFATPVPVHKEPTMAHQLHLTIPCNDYIRHTIDF